MVGDYFIIGIYFSIIMAIGIYFARRTDNSSEYLLGGRKMPFYAVGISCFMALLSSISIVMVPGEIFNNGLILFFISSLILLLEIPLYLLFTRFYFKLGSFTPYEYLEYRYDRTVRGVVAISAFYSRTLYIGMVLYTTAKVFEGGYGWNPFFTICFVGLFGLLYTVLGGFKAVVWTDVLHFVVMVGGFVFVVVILCQRIDGGAWEAVSFAWREGHGLPQFSDPDFYSFSPYVRLLLVLLIWNALTEQLTSSCSDQISIQRLLSTGDWKSGFKSQILSTSLGLTSNVVLWFIGFALFTFYFQRLGGKPVGIPGDLVFFRFVMDNLPWPLPGLFMAALLAAVMSTLDSAMNAMATVYLKEIHQKFINKNLAAARELRISRIATAGVGIFAVMLAVALNITGQWLSQSVAELRMVFALLLGAAVLPAFLFAVLSARANSRLIWCYTFFAFGETIGMNIWYALSRASEQAFLNGLTSSFGWAGRLEWFWVAIPLAPALVLLSPYVFKRATGRNTMVKLAALCGILGLGLTFSMLVWYVFSNIYITDVPRARSFAFFMPLSFIVAFIVLWFCPKQPEAKYRGLTLATLGDEITALKK